MRTILVTGGTGFIGQYVVQRLLDISDFKIVVVDNLHRGKNKDLFLSALRTPDRITFYGDDIRSPERMLDIVNMEKVTDCVHLAAKTSVLESISNPTETHDVNVMGTLSVLKACANKVRNFVFASSAAVYGEPKILPIPEEHPLAPISPYGTSKVLGETHVMSYKHLRQIQNAIILRFFNVYGHGQSSDYAGVITKFAEQLSIGSAPVIYGDGKQTRDFVSVIDITNAIVSALNAEVSGIFNIGSGNPISIDDLVKKMLEAYGLNIAPSYTQQAIGDIRMSYADISKAKNILKYVVTQDLDTWLKSGPMIRGVIARTSS